MRKGPVMDLIFLFEKIIVNEKHGVKVYQSLDDLECNTMRKDDKNVPV